MELGITPIVTWELAMQLLAGSKIIEVNNSVREDGVLLDFLALGCILVALSDLDFFWAYNDGLMRHIYLYKTISNF
ncbi:hypothetical protein KFK09_009325 [Dendrobium nobile]|uniref:Uncharacterized protein n=1 Tax=Dendrobium nobile TaxID=94219 RepID=A0A8T3BQF9_DENNO|nr:hypothetical protein KFK09_009325 [Dendrobium nobile]